MLRVLLASADETLVDSVKSQLFTDCVVETCCDGESALGLLHDFDPDVMMIDTRLSGTDAITVIRTARAVGKRLGILVVTVQRDICTLNRLAALEVNYVLNKPCRPIAVVSHIWDIGFYIKNPDADGWCVENDADEILLDLGFRMGPGNYSSIRQAILAKYYAVEGVMMKDIYYEVTKAFGGNSRQKEKAIRDGIKAAWARGDPKLWQMYFPLERDKEHRCPTNEEFVTRIAACLQRKTRIKRPYDKKREKAM